MRLADEHDVGRLSGMMLALLEDLLASLSRSCSCSFNHLLGVVGCLLDRPVTCELLEASLLQARRPPHPIPV